MNNKLEKYSHIVHGIYLGYNDNIGEAIEQILKKMPEDERDYFINNCWVISVKQGASWPFEHLIEREWLVILADNLTAGNAQEIIAKEFAHVYLRHLWSLMK